MRHWLRDPAALTVTALAVHRLTRLVTRDTLPPLEDARNAVEDAIEARAPRWAHGLTCPWCVSMWLAAATVGAGELAHRTGRDRGYRLVTTALAASSAAGLLADLEVS